MVMMVVVMAMFLMVLRMMAVMVAVALMTIVLMLDDCMSRHFDRRLLMHGCLNLDLHASDL